MRSWLTWLVGSVMHNLTPAFGEKFFWGHHGMSFIGKETNELPELVFQLKNNQTANQEHENGSRTSPGLFRDFRVRSVLFVSLMFAFADFVPCAVRRISLSNQRH